MRPREVLATQVGVVVFVVKKHQEILVVVVLGDRGRTTRARKEQLCCEEVGLARAIHLANEERCLHNTSRHITHVRKLLLRVNDLLLPY